MIPKWKQLDNGDHNPTHLQTTNNFVEPVPTAITNTDQLHIPSKRGLPVSDDGSLPFEIKKISLTAEQFTAEQPTLFPNLLRSVPTPSDPIEHPTKLPTLQTGKITYTGAANSSDPSNNSNELTPSNTNTLARIGNAQSAAEAEHLMHNSKAYKLSTVESHGTEDEEMKSTASLRLDGDDDSDTILQEEEEVHATSSTAPIVAQGSSTNIPISRDTSFSTRPSRKAARKASAVMAAARKKNKKKGKGGGGGGGGAGGSGPTPPPFVASGAPPPPPPPPPRRSTGRGGPPSGGHNVTWGFTTGSNGPWIEPPVVNDPIFARPSEKKGLKKETQEAIKQLEYTASGYDPHSPGRVAKQERMYQLRLLGNTGQWATSNVRGATDWEEIQKQRMGVAVREAMRIQEEEDEAEEMERMRMEMAKHRADKKKDNGEGSSKSAPGQVMKAKRGGGGEGSATMMGGSDDDDDDDDTATLVGRQSGDDDDDRSVHDASLETIPRSFNEDFAQRLAATRQPQSTNNRGPVNTRPDGNGNRAFGYNYPYSSDKSRRYPFPFHGHFQQDNVSGHAGPTPQNNAPTAPFQALPTPPASFLQQNYAPAPTYASSSAALREVASNMRDEMDDIASRDATNDRTTGDGGPVLMHDFEYDNLRSSGQIGGAADTREASLAPGPFVFRGAGVGGATSSQRQEEDNYNARMTDLMERHLGLQLETPPPAGEAFPALTGEWPRYPADLVGETTRSSEEDSRRGYGGAGARRGFGPYGEGSSGAGQHQSSSRPE